MAWRTHPAIVALRTVGRYTGVNRLLCTLASKKPYEEQFDRALTERVRVGDCAWDVGANRGIYMAKLLDAVGETGSVVGFEPLLENASALRDVFGDRANVQLVELALGRENTAGIVVPGGDALRATTRVVHSADTGRGGDLIAHAGSERISVRTGDSLVNAGAVPYPHVVKLDVEGAELDCLIGMRAILGSRHIRAVGVEIHYGLLAARGQAGAPRDIERLLLSFGYEVTWTDRSHLIADLPKP
jgi:FkbM family methyltransferase